MYARIVAISSTRMSASSSLRWRAVWLALCACMLCWAARPAQAQLAVNLIAGQVRSLQGQAVVERNGQMLPLIQGSAVLTGDVLVTRPQARLEVVMRDGAVVQLQQSSRLKLNDYRLAAQPQQSRSVMQLVEGGLRTVTGWIGKLHNDENYQLQTPVAMIGVRGTDYSVQLAASSMQVQVHEGAVAVCNGGGCVDVAQGQSASATAANSKPTMSSTRAAGAQGSNKETAHPSEGSGGAGADRTGGLGGAGGWGAGVNAGGNTGSGEGNTGNQGQGWGVGGTPPGGRPRGNRD